MEITSPDMYGPPLGCIGHSSRMLLLKEPLTRTEIPYHFRLKRVGAEKRRSVKAYLALRLRSEQIKICDIVCRSPQEESVASLLK
jgi:hypothetical protein